MIHFHCTLIDWSEFYYIIILFYYSFYSFLKKNIYYKKKNGIFQLLSLSDKK